MSIVVDATNFQNFKVMFRKIFRQTAMCIHLQAANSLCPKPRQVPNTTAFSLAQALYVLVSGQMSWSFSVFVSMFSWLFLFSAFHCRIGSPGLAFVGRLCFGVGALNKLFWGTTSNLISDRLIWPPILSQVAFCWQARFQDFLCSKPAVSAIQLFSDCPKSVCGLYNLGGWCSSCTQWGWPVFGLCPADLES